MTQNRKETAWKKNRRFGDFYGGRMRLKCTDGIFKRYHDLLPPAEGEERVLVSFAFLAKYALLYNVCIE